MCSSEATNIRRTQCNHPSPEYQKLSSVRCRKHPLNFNRKPHMRNINVPQMSSALRGSSTRINAKNGSRDVAVVVNKFINRVALSVNNAIACRLKLCTEERLCTFRKYYSVYCGEQTLIDLNEINTTRCELRRSRSQFGLSLLFQVSSVTGTEATTTSTGSSEVHR